MTNNELLEIMESTFSSATELLKQKNADYTRGNAEALAFFKETAKETGDDPKKVLYTLWRKHWAAIGNYIKTNGQAESEPISGRIADLINYAVLFKALVTEELKAKENSQVNL